MNSFRYLTTVLALVNVGLVAQVSAAPTASSHTLTGKTTTNKVFVGTE